MKIAMIYLCDGWDYYPPMNLITIISYVKSKLENVDIRIFDVNFGDIDKSLEKFQPDFVGFTCMSLEYTKTINKCKQLKKILNVPFILGGVHISVLPNSLNPIFELGIIGEGEKTMLEIINHFRDYNGFVKDKLIDINGIVYFDNNKLIKTEPRELINLKELPKLDWKLINPRTFSRRIAENDYRKHACLLTSRGCPYKCRFCVSTNHWKTCRWLTAKQVVDEIKDLYHNHGIRSIWFSDDLFGYNIKRTKEITEMLRKEKILGKIIFGCQLRVNVVNDAMLGSLKELGITHISFGFESGSSNYLSYLKRDKSLTVEDNKRAIQLCKKYGIKPGGTLIFGGANETIQDMKQTLDFIDYCIKENVDNIGTFVMTPFPGSEMWEIAKARGKVSDNMDDWSKLNFANAKDAFLLDDNISKETFLEIFAKSRKKLGHFRKKRIIRLVTKHPIMIFLDVLRNPKYSFYSAMRVIGNKAKVGK